jgi:HPt (histidine-containing phosphotransfer) domain-containing protein
MPQISPTTFAELKQMSGEDLIDELIDALLEEAPKMIAAMQAALGAHDVDAFRRNAHSLKSNAETFGATTLAAIARELEAMARAGDLNVGTRLDALHESYRAASEELRDMRA